MRILRGQPVPLDIGHCLISGSVSTTSAFAIPRSALTYKPNVKHWMMTDGYAATLTASYFADCLAPLDGVIWKVRWRDLEPTTLGGYSWTALDNAVNRCIAVNKPISLRLWFKSYTDANDPPLTPPLPAYIVGNSATYGGATGSGGMRKSHSNGVTWQGWGAMLEQPAVKERFLALIDAIGARYGSTAQFDGFGTDESIWGAVIPLPAELTAQTVVDVNKEILLRIKASMPPWKNTYQFANYLDNGSILTVGDFIDWGTQQGMTLGITDVFSIPQRAASIQWSYYSLPIAERRTVVCLEGLSYGANDGTLSTRMDDNYRSAAYLGPDVVAWCNVQGTAGPYWSQVLRVLGR